MERLTTHWCDGTFDTFDPIDIYDNEYSKINYERVLNKLGAYEDAEEQGLLLRLDSKDKLIDVLATKLLHSEFGNCYMCTNSMKNITLDGVNNGCDGQCNTSEEFTVDDFLKKIVEEMKRKEEAEQKLASMQKGE